MSSRRTKIRYSLLALIVSYLREATVDTAKFTLVENVSGAYPFVEYVWTFALGAQLYQAVVVELSDTPLPLGVMVQFSIERPDDSQAMPQFYTCDVRVLIRVPPMAVGESVSQQLALKIDQALFRAAGRCEIKDYSQNPAVSTGTYLTWTPVPRGSWEMLETDTELEEFQLTFQVQYAQPESEW